MANTVLNPGEPFDGRYVIQDDLGHGGYGHVYLVTDTSSKMQDLYALKLLKSNATAEAVRKFRNEASVLLELSADKNPHPHIVFGHVGYFHPGTNREPYILMQYAPNETVAATLKKRAPWGLPEVEAISYIVQAGSALQYLHNKQILHRDVKEQNMLLDAKRQVLLSDFGIAIRLYDLPVTEPEGTPLYMSPEAFEKLPSVYSDQFALAVTTYVLLCGLGKYPYPNKGDFSRPVLIKNRVQQYSTLLAELELVIQKGLAKKEEDRYPSVSKYVRALQDVLKNADGQGSKPPISVFSKPSIPAGQHNRPVRPIISQPRPVLRPIAPPVPKPVKPTLPVQPYSSTTPKPYRSRGCTRRTFMLGAVATSLAVGVYELPRIGSFLTNVWDALLHKEGRTPINAVADYSPGAEYLVRGLAWSPDSQSIALCVDLTNFVRDSHELLLWAPLRGGGSITLDSSGNYADGYPMWSPDGKYIVVSNSSLKNYLVISIFDFTRRAAVATYTIDLGYGNYASALSPDGKHLAVGGYNGIFIIDATRKGNLELKYGYGSSRYKWQNVSASDGWINTVDLTWSPDGTRIVAIGGTSASASPRVQIWDVASARVELTSDNYGSASWSPDGKYICFTDEQRLQVWNVSTRKIVTTYNGHGANVSAVAWSPDSKYIASGDNYGEFGQGAVHIWRATTGHAEFIYETDNVVNLAWSPNGKYLVYVYSNGTQQTDTLHVWTPGIE